MAQDETTAHVLSVICNHILYINHISISGNKSSFLQYKTVTLHIYTIIHYPLLYTVHILFA